MKPITPKNEGTGLGEHTLSPHAHLHLSHVTPLQDRLKKIQHMFNTHPILSQKTQRIRSLAADRPVENKAHVAHLANILLNHEKSMWKNIKIEPKAIKPYSQSKIELTDLQKKSVNKHQDAVNAIARGEFLSLAEYALISDEKIYPQAHIDYQRFMSVAGVAQQISEMQDLLEKQHLMLRQLDSRLTIDAHRVAPLISDIKLSLQDQQVIASRFPEFRFQ